MGYPYLNLYVRHDESKFKNTLLYKTQIKYKERNTFSINYELVKSLVYPFIEQQSLNVLYTKTIRKIDFILNRKPEKVTIDLYTNNYPRLENNRRRCYKCIEQFQYKEGKNGRHKIRNNVRVAEKVFVVIIV